MNSPTLHAVVGVLHQASGDPNVALDALDNLDQDGLVELVSHQLGMVIDSLTVTPGKVECQRRIQMLTVAYCLWLDKLVESNYWGD